MANQEEDESRKLQYPLDSKSYEILDEIGQGMSAIVYKATCTPMNSALVAIKSIDLDQSRANLDNIRREAKTMSLLSHPNILKAHCSFTVDQRLWVVMPFMSAGSLQSIISSSFPNGLSEPCIATVLKETLSALSYLHDQGHLHRDIKAGNILIDSNGSVKLADFGVSASIYESSGPASMLTDVAGTPYWMAPEVIHSHTGYSLKADIWSFGITALELAHGRPPLSHLPPSKSLIMKITKRTRISDYEKCKDSKSKKFSKAFKDMVGLCLDQDPSKRPSAEKLLKHSFFKNCNKGSDFLIKNLLQGLPSVEQRFNETKLRRVPSMTKKTEEDDKEEDDDDGEEGVFLGEIVKQRRISGWNFNSDDFELDPVFPTEREFEEIKKQVRFGGETIIPDKGGVSDETQLGGGGVAENIGSGGGGGVDRRVILASLMYLRKSLDEQREAVNKMIGQLSVEVSVEGMSREEKLMLEIEKLKIELEDKKKITDGLMEDHIKLQDADCSDFEEMQKRKNSLMQEIEKLKIELENEKKMNP